MGFLLHLNLYIPSMKHIKAINEFWNPFRRKEPLTSKLVEEKCTELVDIIYDLFDEYDIVDGNNDYYSQGQRINPTTGILVRNVEPTHDHWRYGVFGFSLENPKDRIIISADMKKTDEIFPKLEKIKKNIEKQIGCDITLFYNLKKKSDMFDNLDRLRGEKGRILITIKHSL